MAVVSWPGSDVLDGGQDPAASQGSKLVEPGERHVARFERIIDDQTRHRTELEED